MFDLLYFHQVGDRKIEIASGADGVFTWLLKQKKAGKTRFAGISGHNRPHKFVRLLESGEVDVLMVALNFVDRHTYNFEEKVLPAARKHEVGIVAMKVFAARRRATTPTRNVCRNLTSNTWTWPCGMHLAFRAWQR